MVLIDVILGDDFMVNHEVELNYRNRCAVVCKGRRRIMVTRAPLVQESLKKPTKEGSKLSRSFQRCRSSGWRAKVTPSS
jgi:hypothetical protein